MTRHSRLLIIDGVINITLGVVLLIFPSGLVEFLGVPAPASSFYPSILGGVLIGIGIALFLETQSTAQSARGLGLMGAVVINLCGGIVLGVWLLSGELDLPLRGSVFLWGLVLLLVAISCIELVARYYAERKSA